METSGEETWQVIEIESAPDVVMGGGIDEDVRELDAEFQGVLAHQIGDIVLQIGIPVVPAIGSVMPGAQSLKSSNVNNRQATKLRHARVDGEGLHVRWV